MSKKAKPTFEEAVRRLEELIEAMEDGSAPLTELVAKYEEGSKLLRECQSQLQAAELKIEKLNLKTGETESFESEEADED